MRTHAIERVIDVGANSGQYASGLRESGYAGWIHSYEPLPSAFLQLQKRSRGDSSWSAHQLAVSESPGSLRLNIAGNSVSSSVLEMSRLHTDAEPSSRFVSTVEVRATTLAEILAPFPDVGTMLKIDTQGYERQVLAGGSGALGKVQLLEIELSLRELYVGQPLFRDMDAMLLAEGFHLVSLSEGFADPRTGELLQLDAIYARRAYNGGLMAHSGAD